jgi:CelD/BcsL family acetyltransferase involved in cellulose biosynthesis
MVAMASSTAQKLRLAAREAAVSDAPGASSAIECLPQTLEGAAIADLVLAPVTARAAYRVDPLRDSRWSELIERHSRASLFHSPSWLKALSRTYGYTPMAYTTAAPGERIEGGVVFCEVESWLTGRRLVSLPFSDHCDPLVDRQEDWDALMSALARELAREQWQYFEMRPRENLFDVATPLQRATVPYTLHVLDLSPAIDTLFRNCHKNSTQRKILRSEREGLRYCEGRTEDLLDAFYRLHTITRKRHRRPPQPRKWFVELIESFGDDLKIRVARTNGQAVAAVVTIRHKDTMVYKYGGSDPAFNHLGSMHLLLWGAIQEAKSAGLRQFDFGRTDEGQHGLITFKKRWGTEQTELIYSRYGVSDKASHMFESSNRNWKALAAKYALAHLPPSLLAALGQALYRHVG